MRSPLNQDHWLIPAFHAGKQSLRSDIPHERSGKNLCGPSPYRMSLRLVSSTFHKGGTPRRTSELPSKVRLTPQILKQRIAPRRVPPLRRPAVARRSSTKMPSGATTKRKAPTLYRFSSSERGSHEFLAHIFSFPCTHGPGLVQSEKMLLGPGLFVLACAHHEYCYPERDVV
jgi:hypothetical protein